MMKFYMTPGSCSTGIHILLEELELIFQVYLVNLLAEDHYKPEFLALNPKASIPVLVTEKGLVISDFQAIAWWLAQSFPKAKLWPESIEAQVKVLEVMNYAINTLHMQGFARIFTTDKFTSDNKEFDKVKQQGKEIIQQGFNVIENLLDKTGYIIDHFSIADVALFYVEFWADKTHFSLPPSCAKHYQLMLQRPAVKQVLMEEGYKVTTE